MKDLFGNDLHEAGGRILIIVQQKERRKQVRKARTKNKEVKEGRDR